MPLNISRDWIDQVDNGAMQEASVKRIADYMRKNLPPLQDVPEDDLRAFVRRNKARAPMLRLQAENSVARFCVIQYLTEERAVDDPEVQRLFWRPGADPDKDIVKMMDSVVAQLRALGL